MTIRKEQVSVYVQSALRAGLSGKASIVYVSLLETGTSLSPKSIIIRTNLHRQYVYDAIHELLEKRLVTTVGVGRSIKYIATSPDRILQDIEKERIQAIDNVENLIKLYNKSPIGLVEVISGSQAVIEGEFKILEASDEGDFLDIIGGAGMRFIELFGGKVEEYSKIGREKGLKVRYIGSYDDVKYNNEHDHFDHESRVIDSIKDIVNVCIRPKSVTFNIYHPEVLTVRVHSESAVTSQRALFDILWNSAKKL